jgi:MoaA/NifB/PqqE/SkfB family radical SAM enzyme
MNAVLNQLPILVLYPHNRCNCRCVMCDIWKQSDREEISVADLQRHLDDFERLSVRWVVFSGGEPLMHSDLFRLSRLLRERSIRTTLLSTGLLFERYARSIAKDLDDAIVSLDGPAEVHDRIRRVPGAFRAISQGIEAIRAVSPSFPISARCTVQRENHGFLTETATEAQRLGLNSISFLAADVSSTAFSRAQPWQPDRQSQIALTEAEIDNLRKEIQVLWNRWGNTGFIRESFAKLERIPEHFRAHLGLTAFRAPSCNAPWVSAVIEADGTVRPCFFHQPIGRVNGLTLLQVLNGPEALAFRSSLNVSSNPVCQKCVCSLNWSDIHP